MDIQKELMTRFGYLGQELISRISELSALTEFEPGTELVRYGQYTKVVPILLHGLVKVYTRLEEKDLLLYYIQPEQSCIMSFSSCINHEKSKIVAITEEKSLLLLMPSDEVVKWIKEFPQLNVLFFNQYDLRYHELVENMHQLIYHKLDQRLLDFLRDRIRITGKNHVKLSHKEIANELGTAREVVSRLLKKLEKSGMVVLSQEGLALLPPFG
jgi:CRP/FNR family transcriptional regulator